MSKGTQNTGQQSSGGGTTIASLMPIIWLLGTPIMLGASYLLIINPLLKRFGIKDSAEDKEISKVNDDVRSAPYWNPSWYKINGGDTLSDSYARMYAEKLYEAIDGWGTNESEIGGVFANLNTKGNISLVSEIYSNIYGRDLLNDLWEDLDDTEFTQYVGSKIASYPS